MGGAKATEKILAAVRGQLRVQQGRDPEPSAGPVDSQTGKGADTVGRDSRGSDAGKRINGRKRVIVTDTLGLLITVVVCAASRQDRDDAKPVLLQAYLASRIRFVFADSAFAVTNPTGYSCGAKSYGAIGPISRSLTRPTRSAPTPSTASSNSCRR